MHGVLCAVVANAHRNPDSQPLEPGEFMPSQQQTDPMDWRTMRNNIQLAKTLSDTA